jgi:hypothetical protein
MVYIPTKPGDFRANVGIHIPAPWFAYGILNHTKPRFRLGVENMNRWIGDWDSPVMAPWDTPQRLVRSQWALQAETTLPADKLKHVLWFQALECSTNTAPTPTRFLRALMYLIPPFPRVPHPRCKSVQGRPTLWEYNGVYVARVWQ